MHSNLPIFLKEGTTIGKHHFKVGDTSLGGHGTYVDGVGVNKMEEDAYHIHAHLALFYNGNQIAIPKGIGIMHPRPVAGNSGEMAGNAYYWLHTHDATGVIHIESPIRKLEVGKTVNPPTYVFPSDLP